MENSTIRRALALHGEVAATDSIFLEAAMEQSNQPERSAVQLCKTAAGKRAGRTPREQQQDGKGSPMSASPSNSRKTVDSLQPAAFWNFDIKSRSQP